MADQRRLDKQETLAQSERDLADRIAKAERGLVEEDRRFAVVLADPPWSWKPYGPVSDMDRAAANHYPTLPVDGIKALAPPATDDAVLFLWAISSMLPEALDVVTSWGFSYKTSAVWVKPAEGTGYWFRSRHEHLLVGTRGHIPAPAPGTQWGSVIEAPTRGHSMKPDVVYKLIESYYPTLPKLEMFARTARPNWVSWGAEASPAAGASPTSDVAAGKRLPKLALSPEFIELFGARALARAGVA